MRTPEARGAAGAGGAMNPLGYRTGVCPRGRAEARTGLVRWSPAAIARNEATIFFWSRGESLPACARDPQDGVAALRRSAAVLPRGARISDGSPATAGADKHLRCGCVLAAPDVTARLKIGAEFLRGYGA